MLPVLSERNKMLKELLLATLQWFLDGFALIALCE